jgi:hypothetical protein
VTAQIRKQRSGVARLAKWKTDPGDDLGERLRQFGVVCVVKAKLASSIGSISTARRGSGDLQKIGREMFGLTGTEISYCLGHAQNFLYEVCELTRIRARRGLPIDSDAMMAAILKRGAA